MKVAILFFIIGALLLVVAYLFLKDGEIVSFGFEVGFFGVFFIGMGVFILMFIAPYHEQVEDTDSTEVTSANSTVRELSDGRELLIIETDGEKEYIVLQNPAKKSRP